MIDRFRIRNSIGKYFTIKLREPEESGFLIKSVTGLSSPKSGISASDYAFFDGSVFGNSKVEPRNIVFEIDFFQTKQKTIEQIRSECYDMFPLKEQVTIDIYKDDVNETCYTIKGYVESNKTDIFTKNEGTRVSIICPDPYFTISSLGTSYPSYLSNIVPMFQFPVCIGNGQGQISFIISYDSEGNEIYLDSTIIEAGQEELKDYILTPNEDGGYTAVAPNANKVTTENEEGGLTARATPPDPIYIMDPTITAGEYESIYFPGGNLPETIVNNDPMVEFGRIKGSSDTKIIYDGLGEIGIKIIIEILGDITGIKVKNKTRNESIEIDSSKVSAIIGDGFKQHDTIEISSVKGKKSAKLIRDGISYNIMHALTSPSKWIYIQTGTNVFSYTTTSGFENAYVYFDYESKTLGV